MEPGQENWKAIYEFDTPVVWFPCKYARIWKLKIQIHVDKLGSEQNETTTEALKLMHRFKEEDVVRLMDQAERS